MNFPIKDPIGLEVEQTLIRNAALVYRAINNKTRQVMLRRIHSKKQITVTELYVELDLEQPVVSNHLAVLRRTGFVLSHRVGRQIFYSVNYSRLDQVHGLSANILNHAFHKGPMDAIYEKP
jgi:DNA-binding transcriptional ArsR family regulator